jgi:hypothetical protein
MQILGTAPRNALKCRNRITRILEQIIHEQVEAMDRGEKTVHESLIGVLLRLQKEASLPIELTNDTIVALMFVSLASSDGFMDHISISPPFTIWIVVQPVLSADLNLFLLGLVRRRQRYLIDDTELVHDRANPVPGSDGESPGRGPGGLHGEDHNHRG